MVKVTGQNPSYQPSSASDDESTTGRYKKVDGEKRIPTTAKESGGESKSLSKSLSERSVEENPGIKNKLKSFFSSKPSSGAQPHHSPGYLIGGGVLMAAGGALLAIAGPIGVGVFLMGMIAYAHAFTNVDDGDDVGQQEGPPPSKEQLDKQKNEQAEKTKKDEEDRKKTDKDSKANSTKSTDSRPGEFVAQPVDFSGGKIDFPENVQPTPPPPLQANYSGPGWDDVYNSATQMGVPPEMANNYMNNCYDHLSGLAPGQADNPANLVSIPLVKNFAEEYTQQVGAEGVPQIAGLNNMEGFGGELYRGIVPVVSPNVQLVTPQLAGDFVAVKVDNESGASPRESVTLPVEVGEIIQSALNNSRSEDVRDNNEGAELEKALELEVARKESLVKSVNSIVKDLQINET